MAYLSQIAAVLGRLESTVTSATAYFDEVPMSTGAGAVPAFPYLVLHDEGTTPEYTLEYEAIETTRFRVEVFATASTLETVVRQIKYGMTAYNARGGLDWFITTVAGQTTLQTMRTGEQRFQEASRQGDGKLVYRCQLKYEITANLTA